MADVYINPEATTNGTGASPASPYNSFTEVNAWNSDRTGDWVYIKAGTTARSILNMIGGATNYNVGAYGDGDKPIINAADIATSWTAEGDFWYTSGPTVEPSVFADRELFTRQTTKSSLVSSEYYYDTVNDRVYIADNPNDAVYEVVQRAYAARTHDGALTVRDLDCRYGLNAAFEALDLKDDFNLVSVDTYYGGTQGGAQGRNNFILKGVSNADPALRLSVKYCTAQGSRNNDFELWYMTGAMFEQNISYGSLANMFELWEYVQDSTFQRNRVYGTDGIADSRGRCNRMFWLAGPVDTTANGVNTGNTFKNNLGVGSADSGNFIHIADTNNNNLIYHNTVINFGDQDVGVNNGIFLRIEADAPVPTGTVAKGNIISTDKDDVFTNINSAATVTFDDNIWYNPTKNQWLYDGATPTEIAAFNALTGVGTDFNEDPVLDSDYAPDTGSPAINAGATGLGVVEDLNGYSRYGNPDIGAVEKRLTPQTTTRIDAE